MTEIFPAVTNRRLAFYEVLPGLSALDVAPWTRVMVTIHPNGQHAMTLHADGKTFTRIGSFYTRATGPLHPDELGGIGLGTEYGDKVADLAFNLARLPYPGIQSWADVEPHIVDNYYADAHEIIRAYPHLLTLGERERLAPVFAEVAA